MGTICKAKILCFSCGKLLFIFKKSAFISNGLLVSTEKAHELEKASRLMLIFYEMECNRYVYMVHPCICLIYFLYFFMYA